MNNQSRILVACSVSVMMLLTGCASSRYRMHDLGKEAPTNAVSTIQRHGEDIKVEKIDSRAAHPSSAQSVGKSAPWVVFGCVGLFPMIVVYSADQDPEFCEVLPGKHEVTLSFEKYIPPNIWLRSVTPITTEVTLRAGCRYVFNAEAVGMRWFPTMKEYDGNSARVVDIGTQGDIKVPPEGLNAARNATLQQGGGRADFERELQRMKDSGELKTTDLTITYPDGTRKTIQDK